MSRESLHTKRLIDKAEYLTLDQEKELVDAINGSDPRKAQRARDRLVMAHMKLARSFVYKRANKIKSSAFDAEDLLQEAAIALVWAASKFDAGHGVRFSTYASHWIRSYVDVYIHMNNYAVRFASTGPNRRTSNMFGYLMYQTHEAMPNSSYEERLAYVAGKLGVNLNVLKAIAPFLEQKTVSLSSPVSADPNRETYTIQDTIADEAPRADELIEYQIEFEEHMERVHRIVREMTEREQLIFRERLLCDREDRTSLERLGEQLGVSKERVRQLETRIFERLQEGVLKEAGKYVKENGLEIRTA